MIKIHNLTKSFNGHFKPVIEGLNLNIRSGDFCVIIGSNGSGKSTLLKLISGEHSPSSGRVKVFSKIAQVVQDVNLGTVAEMTLLENLVLSETISPSPLLYTRHRNAVIDKLSSLGIGLEHYIDQPLNSLSGGQRQVVATLMAINSGSKIILLDEHTSALDPQMQRLLMEFTSEQIKQNCLTAMMVTHNLSDALQYGNRLIMMHQGRAVLDIEGDEKAGLKADELLSMFHNFEDKYLIQGC